METNTVLLAVEQYNELRDFKQKIEEGYTLSIASSNFYSDRRFITTDKAIEEVVNANKELQKQIDCFFTRRMPPDQKASVAVSDQLNDLRGGTNKELSVSEIKRMSIWKFLKWRKS